MDLKKYIFSKQNLTLARKCAVCKDHFLSSPVCCLNYQHKSNLLTNCGNYITCLQARGHVVSKAAQVGKYCDGLKHVFLSLLLTPAAEGRQEQAGEPGADDAPRPGWVSRPN